MSLLTIFIIAIALGLDSFVALFAIGASNNCQSQKIFLRLSLTVGAFHFFMPIIGSYFSVILLSYLENYATYLSAAIFAFLGFKMIKEAFSENPSEVVINMTKALLLSYALSIDALAAGFSLGLVKENHSIYIIASIFALAAFAMSYIGYSLGNKCSHWNTKYTYLVGGAALIVLGIKAIL